MQKYRKIAAGALLSLAIPLTTTAYAQSSTAIFEKEPACHTLQPASSGGPLPQNPDVLVLRYFSYGNYEVAYQGKVILLDAFYDTTRSPLAVPTGLKQEDVTKADAIFVGHTHLDHFADAPAIAKRTGANIYLGPPGRKYLEEHGVPEPQIQVVRGGETIKRKGYTVQTALGIHMVSPAGPSAAYREFIEKGFPLTDEQQKQFSAWLTTIADAATKREDPQDPENDTIYHGTIIYTFTFDNGFRLVYSDTAGVLSGGEKVLADQIHASGGKIDLAILGYLDSGFSVKRAIRTAMDKVKVWEPRLFLPSHWHDGDWIYPSPMPEMPTAPLFESFREQTPNTLGIEPLYRSPVCVNTKTDEFFVGNDVR